MNNEEKIIDRVMMIDQWKVAGDIYTQDELNAIGELLDLYKKEQEKNKKIEDKKEEIYAIGKTNYTIGMLDERSQWYKKIDKMIESYKKLDKEEFAKQGNFDTEISVLEELKRKEE